MRLLTSTGWVAAVVVLILAIASGGAYADEPIPMKARTLAERGRRAHDRGEYARAITAFKEAYVLAPSDALLFNLAQSYRLRGDCEDAAMMYKRFLASEPSAEAAELASAHLVSVERCARPEPVARTIAPRLRTPIVKKDVPSAPPPSTPARPLAAPGAPPEGLAVRTKLQLGLAIGGATALGVALVYAVKAQAAEREIEALYTSGAKWKDIEAIDARGHHDDLAAKLFGAGGLLAVGTAVTLYVLDRRDDGPPAVAVVPSRSGGQVSVSWAF